MATILNGYREGILTQNLHSLGGNKLTKGQTVRYIKVNVGWAYMDLNNKNRVVYPSATKCIK